jgi:acetyl-CoA carboxylase biotin carboxylase subunit
MFKKILVANRGEVAIRIIRACRELGIKTVAVYSEADKNSLHVKMADESYCIGPPQPIKSYLNIPAIVAAAEVSGAEAVHPGYGFLAESPSFAEICEAVDLTFIGPPAKVIEKMGHKAEAKREMQQAGIPVIPGTDEKLGDNSEEALEFARKVSFPLIIKAAAGGGGRGMRIVHSEGDLLEELDKAKAEAKAAFGNGELYLEKYLEEPRHVEVQIIADKKGNVIHLGERDCSIQRRHQKLLEESPCPVLDAEKREEIGELAKRAAKAIGYENAGTIEFLMDSEGNFYFMEANTRLQVEHPVTEEITGIDIVKLQILVAAGEDIPFSQEDIEFKGHAIEFRINSEDPSNNFLPVAGKIEKLTLPGGPGVRVDTHIYPGYKIPPYYDSLLAKLVVWGRTREEAISRGERALEEFVVEGLPTTISFHKKVLGNAFFKKGEVYTNFVSRRLNLS